MSDAVPSRPAPPVTRGPRFTLGILAGGFSRRMGRDKSSLRLGGRTLLEHMAERLAPPGVPVLVATRPGGPGTDGPFECRHDLIPGAGPLPAMAALLRGLRTPFLLVVPCDLPFLPYETGARLLQWTAGVDGVLLETRGGSAPFPALLRRRTGPLIERLVAAGERRAIGWALACRTAIVPFETVYPGRSEDDVLANMNTPEDYQEALSRMERGGSVDRHKPG